MIPNSTELEEALQDQDRLDALYHLQILDSPAEAPFDRITRLARTITGSAATLLSFIDADRHFCKSSNGLPEPWASQRQIPLTHSYSKFVIATGQPLIIRDAREHPLTASSPAISDLSAVAYLGYPLITRSGHLIGTLCTIEYEPRDWTQSDLDTLGDIAALAMTELILRADIARLEEVEATLRESEQRFHELTNNLRHVFWLRTLDSNEMLYLSPAYETLFGQSRDELYRDGRSFLRAVHPEDHSKLIKKMKRVHQEPFIDDYRLIRPDGEVRWLRVNAAPVNDENGIPYRVAGIVEDITEERTAKELLAERENWLRSILNSEPACVSVSDRKGILEDINPAGLQLLEARADEEVIGRPIEEFIAPEYRDALSALRARVLNGETAELEFELIGLNGRRRWVEMRAAPLRDAQDEIIAILSLTNDMTERKALEEQLHHSQKMDAVGRLASGVAHDFNNVLTAITGNAMLLLEDLDENEPIRPDLEEILYAAERGAMLTRQLLLVGRSEPPAMASVDLNEIITELERMLQRLIGDDVILSTDLDPAMVYLQADRSRLEQIILNLVVNARDAMPNGGNVTIETRRVELGEEHVRQTLVPAAGIYLRLRVSDTGCGMDRSKISKIFEPFFTTKARGKGTGLGLSTVYSIVRQSGGGIQVESKPGQGTTFDIYLPKS